MEEKPFFAPSGSDDEKPRGQKESDKPKISFSPKGGGSKKSGKKPTLSLAGSSSFSLQSLSWKKIALALLGLVLVFVLLQNTLCAGGSDSESNVASQAEPTAPTQAAEEAAGTDTTAPSAGQDATKEDGSAAATPLPGNSEAREYSGDAVILVNGTLEITAEEVDERQKLIASYLQTNNITDLSDKDKKEAAISQLLQVAWAKEAAREAGIRISPKAIAKASRGESEALTKNLQEAGYSAAQIEDLIRLELTRQALKKKAVKQAKRVKAAKVRQVYKKSKSKKPFAAVKKKLKKKIRKKQVAQAGKRFQAIYESTWSSKTACQPDYSVAAYCGSEL